MGRLIAAGVMICSGLISVRAYAANEVVNGDFSSNAALFTAWPGYTGYNGNPAAISSWTHNGTGNAGINGIDINQALGPVDTSNVTYYAFVQTDGSVLSQTMALSADTSYFISFMAANRADNPTAAGRVTVSDDSTTYYDSGKTSWSADTFKPVIGRFTTPDVIDGAVKVNLLNESGLGDRTVCYSEVSIEQLDRNYDLFTRNVLLFYDNFDSGKSSSLTDPSGRAAGLLKSVLTYTWTSVTDVEVNGLLDWDSNGDRGGNNEQPAANGTQSMRISNNLAKYVADNLWEVEFDQRVAWSHPLTFALSDDVQSGSWAAWNIEYYDFAAGQYGNGLIYDTDNDDATGFLTVVVPNIFPLPVKLDSYHFRIRFDEPNNAATMWIDGEQVVQTTLDFEKTGRYLSWGEPTNYAGALDNISIKLIGIPGMVILLK